MDHRRALLIVLPHVLFKRSCIRPGGTAADRKVIPTRIAVAAIGHIAGLGTALFVIEAGEILAVALREWRSKKGQKQNRHKNSLHIFPFIVLIYIRSISYASTANRAVQPMPAKWPRCVFPRMALAQR